MYASEAWVSCSEWHTFGTIVDNQTKRNNGRWRECDKLNLIFVAVVHAATNDQNEFYFPFLLLFFKFMLNVILLV